MPIVLKSGSLSLLEPSGPVQACTGTALSFNYCGNLVTAEVMLENIERFRNLPCFINVIYDELMNSSRSEEID